jgi:hypothetical protein
MNALLKVFRILAILPLLLSGCAMLPAQTGEEERAASNSAVYESILGKPVNDHIVADFVASNQCSSADQFLLCETVGMALWTDSNQVVETVYLYLNNADGFEPYKGELPFGLKFYDNMAAVEYKLDRQGMGTAGRPDKVAVPDHMHYQATYRQAGMTIIYNYPFADEDATIHAIVMHDKKRPG